MDAAGAGEEVGVRGVMEGGGGGEVEEVHDCVVGMGFVREEEVWWYELLLSHPHVFFTTVFVVWWTQGQDKGKTWCLSQRCSSLRSQGMNSLFQWGVYDVSFSMPPDYSTAALRAIAVAMSSSVNVVS